MFYLIVVSLYVLFFISLISLFSTITKESKPVRYLVTVIYSATGLLFTFLVVAEIVSPSEDANIGLGLSIWLTGLISIVGIIVALFHYLSTKATNRNL